MSIPGPQVTQTAAGDEDILRLDTVTFKPFVATVLALAALIVAAVHLSRELLRPRRFFVEYRELTRAGHTFVDEDRTESVIECGVTALNDRTEIRDRVPAPCTLGDGWLRPQPSGSTIYGTRSEIAFELADNRRRTLVMRVRATPDLAEDLEQSVGIVLNGRELGRHPVKRTWRKVRQRMSPEDLRVGRNHVTLLFDHAVSPRQAGTGPDHHAAAARIDRLAIVKPTRPDAEPDPESPATVWDDTLQTFVIERPGTLVMPTLIPDDAAEIELQLRPSRSVALASARVTLRVEDLDGRGQQTSVSGRSVRDLGLLALPVNGLAGRWALVTAEAHVDGGPLEISPPRVVLTSDPAPVAQSRTAPPAAGATQPDIVLITLDAARADRFSFAGHPRETTPFIDAIAAESLVFPAAYALTPYTLSSVPTMITGLSFLDHGVVGHRDVLSEEAETLAESLRGHGYRTACFSATPNNSRSKGFAQGYDVFRELWREAPSRQSRRAHFLARRVVEWLDTVGDDRPLHLQLHFIPPHAPYDPPRRFDRFTDPAYDGPCDGYNHTATAVDGRESETAPECVEHLLDLYDGNLRTADDATRIVVEALQRRPRWEHTVVLITADHGEAFMEHGRLAHNSTVHREMLQVPFVLRLPPSLQDRSVDTDRLVTLADIFPTLLGTAGIAHRTAGGVNLLAPADPTGGRFAVTRTTGVRPDVGLRSLRWSLILDPAGSRGLYDLTVDPGEVDDLALRQPARLMGLGRILSHRIAQPPRLAVGDGSADISRGDRELLEVLGYVRD